MEKCPKSKKKHQQEGIKLRNDVAWEKCDSYENKDKLQKGIVSSQIPATVVNQCGT